jgi:hypothetical protein
MDRCRRIHVLGIRNADYGHPESRAVYYENTIYNKRKIKDFLTAIRGFKARATACDTARICLTRIAPCRHSAW